MTTPFRPKKVLADAKQAEKQGNAKLAASQYLALSVYLRKKNRVEEGLLLAQKASKLQPDSLRLWLQVAVCQYLLKRKPAAISTLRAFVSSAMERKRVEAYRPYVDAALRELPDLQKIYLDLVLELDRTAPGPFLDQARGFIAQKDFHSARKALYEAFQTRAADSDVVQLLKDCFRDVGKEKEAHRILEKFTKKKLERDDVVSLLEKLTDPGTESGFTDFRTQEKDLHKLIRNLEKELGIELDEGRDQVEPLVKEFRRRSDAILGTDPKARLDMALAFFEMGLYAHARGELAGIPESTALFAQGQILLGEISMAEGSDIAALESFQKALRHAASPESDLWKEAQYRLAQVYHRLGDHTSALKTVERLEQVDSQYRDLRYWKMQILEALSGSQ